MLVKESIQSTLLQINSVEGFEDVAIYQERPEVLVDNDEVGLPVPVISWRITNNVPQISLDKDTGVRDIEVTIDLWGNDSTVGEELLDEVEELMRESGWRLTYSADVPDPAGICHINTRFNY